MIKKKLIKPIIKIGAIKQGDGDLTDYYNKTETNALLDNKLDVSTYQENETIQNNLITKNTNDIVTLTNDLGDIGNIQNELSNKVTKNIADIVKINDEQTIQNNNIDLNKALLDEVIAGLQTLRPFNYVGLWSETKTYERNQVVDYKNGLYLSKLDNNIGNNPSAKNDFWLLVNSIEATIDLSGYYTKIEVDNKLTDYVTLTYLNTNFYTKNELDMRFRDVMEVTDTNAINILNLDKKVDANLVEAKEYTDAQIAKSKLYTTISTGVDVNADLKISALGDIKTNGEYLSSSYRNTYTDLPIKGDGGGFLKVISFNADGTGAPLIQQWYSRDNPQEFYTRRFNNGIWYQWFKFSGV